MSTSKLRQKQKQKIALDRLDKDADNLVAAIDAGDEPLSEAEIERFDKDLDEYIKVFRRHQQPETPRA